MVWQRSILKSNAKVSLRGQYGVSFGVSILRSLISGAASFLLLLILMLLAPSALNECLQALFYAAQDRSTLLTQSLLVPLSRLLLLTVAAAVCTLFLKSAVTVGSARFFLHKRFGDTHVSTLFTGFQQRWVHTVGVLFVTGLIAGIWEVLGNAISRSLQRQQVPALDIVASLIAIAGLVATIYFEIRYSYVDFLLADNPNLGNGRARTISNLLTQGEKGRVFLFYLSFIGWYLLAALASVIILTCTIMHALYGSLSGMMDPYTSYMPYLQILSSLASVLPALLFCVLLEWVLFSLILPYVQSARAELYIFVRDRALNAGLLNPAELNLPVPAPQAPPQQPPVC